MIIRRIGLVAVTALAITSGVRVADAIGASNATSAIIDDTVATQLAQAGPNDDVTVVVHLRERASFAGVKGNFRERQKAVVALLRAKANSSQVGLRAFLATRKRQGRVSSFQPLWIVNSIVVTAKPDVIIELAQQPAVQRISPNEIDIVPTGTPSAPPEPNVALINAPALWNLGFDGQGVVVATLDSGVDVGHPDLAASYRGGVGAWFDPYGQHATPTDLSGHGTATMGVIVGAGNGGTTIGVAPGAKWIAGRVFDDAGGSTTSGIHAAMQWVLDPDNDPNTADAPQVVNNSWGLATPGCNLEFQPDLQALVAAGVVPVFSAGNAGPYAGSAASPANYPEALAVGATKLNDAIYGYSSRGPSACGEPSTTFPDVVAPGVNILSTDRYGLYSYWTGTSIAAPAVAGSIAVLSSTGLATASASAAALLDTAVDIGVAGPDNTFGHGRIDVAAAYQALLNVPPPTTTTTTTTTTSTTTTTVPPTTTTTSTTTTTVPPTTTTTTSTTTTTVPPTTTTTTAVPPPSADVYFSTLGNTNPPGVTGTADDADIYRWNGTSFSRSLDAAGTGSLGLASGANVDGFDRVDATHFYMSFSAATTAVPGLGNVEDEDVVYYANGVWSVYFDGTSRGLTATNLDLDAISIVGGVLYFSTTGNTNPPGVTGTADDADIYSWNGSSFARVWDASANGLASAANVDGYVRLDANNFYLSFSATTTPVPTIGNVSDVDVVAYRSGTWSVQFAGVSRGLVAGSNHDLDAFDIS